MHLVIYLNLALTCSTDTGQLSSGNSTNSVMKVGCLLFLVLIRFLHPPCFLFLVLFIFCAEYNASCAEKLFATLREKSWLRCTRCRPMIPLSRFQLLLESETDGGCCFQNHPLVKAGDQRGKGKSFLPRLVNRKNYVERERKMKTLLFIV